MFEVCCYTDERFYLKVQILMLFTIDALKKFCLMDDTFMSVVFESDKKSVELILSIILEKTDLKVNEVITQRGYNNLFNRSVRVDIFAEDSSGKAYDIEVQRSNEGADPHRARYNSSIMDTRLLRRSKKFKELTDSYSKRH